MRSCLVASFTLVLEANCTMDIIATELAIISMIVQVKTSSFFVVSSPLFFILKQLRKGGGDSKETISLLVYPLIPVCASMIKCC